MLRNLVIFYVLGLCSLRIFDLMLRVYIVRFVDVRVGLLLLRLICLVLDVMIVLIVLIVRSMAGRLRKNWC